MKSVDYPQAQMNLSGLMDHVCQQGEPLLITSANDSAVVLLSLDEFRSMAETDYLLNNPNNAEGLLASIAELEAGKPS